MQLGLGTMVSVSNMVDAMMADGARYPFAAGGFDAWFRQNMNSV